MGSRLERLSCAMKACTTMSTRKNKSDKMSEYRRIDSPAEQSAQRNGKAQVLWASETRLVLVGRVFRAPILSEDCGYVLNVDCKHHLIAINQAE